VVSQFRVLTGKTSKKPYGRMTLDGLDGAVDVVLFEEGSVRDPETRQPKRAGGGRGFEKRPLLERVKPFLAEERVVFVTGEVKRRDDDQPPEIIAEDVIPIECAAEELAGRAILTIDGERAAGDDCLERLEALFGRKRGGVEVWFQVRTAAGTAILRSPEEKPIRVKPDGEFVREAEAILGRSALALSGN